MRTQKMVTEIIYHCETCKKRSKFRNIIEEHEVDCRYRKKMRDKFLTHREEVINEFRLNLSSFNKDIIAAELEKTVRKNLEIDANFTISEMRFDPNVWCTHNAPIGCEKNFMGTDDRPKGFPGFSGRFEMDVDAEDYDRVNKENSFYFVSAVFSNDIRYQDRFCVKGFNSGTGGGGNEKNGRKHFGYDFKMFVQDFPILYEMYKEKVILTDAVYLLNGSQGRAPVYSF